MQVAVSAESSLPSLRRFRHNRQSVKFCGMGLSTVQSGMFRGEGKTAEHGNARLHRSFWLKR
jgi:transposase